MAITPQQARAELARRELARRASQKTQSEEVPYTPPPERKGLGGILKDVEDIPGKVADYAIDVPGKAMESWEQVFSNPGRALKNLIAGAGETIEAPVNLLGAVGPYLKEKGITDKIPGFQIPDTGIEKKMGLDEKQPGDELIRQMFMFAPGPAALKAIPGVKSLAKRSKALSEHGPLKNKLEELESKHEGKTAEHNEANQQFNTLKEFLESQSGYETSNPARLEGKAKDAEAKLAALQQQASETPEHLRATEQPTPPEKTPLSLVEPVRPEEIDISKLLKSEVSDEPVRQAENLLKTNEQKSAELEKQFGEGHLKKGYTHDVPIAEGVTGKVKERKKEIGKIYDTVEKDLEDQHVLIPQTEQLADAEKSVRNLLKDSRGFFKSDEEFEAAVTKMAKADQGTKKGPNDIVPAADVLKNYRTVRHLGQKLRSEAYTSKVASNKELQADMLAKADEFENTANNLEGLLESNDLGGSLATLKTANKRWREEVAPLNRNKTFRQFLQGTGPDNIMKALRGKGPGQEIIRQIIKEDPELLRNVVGQRYAQNPAKLHEFDELTHEYTQHMPEVQAFKESHHASKQSEAQAKMDLEKAKYEHTSQREQAAIRDREQTEVAREKNAKAKEEAKEQTRIKKVETEKENNRLQKEHDTKAKHVKTKQEIKDLEVHRDKLRADAQKMQEKSKRKNITLKEKLDVEHEIKKTREKLAKIDKDIKLKNRALKVLGYGAVSALVGAPVYTKLKSLVVGD